MSLLPNPDELRARARADLRMGLPVVFDGVEPVLAVAIETLDPDRLRDLHELGQVFIGVTDWRAQTLKARAYDGDIARITVPKDATWPWVRSIADPAKDLETPMKGPLSTLRDGDVGAVRRAIALCKEARLLPSVACVVLEDPGEISAQYGLTRIPGDDWLADLDYSDVVSARLPLEVSEAGRLHVFRPADGGEEHYAIEIGKPDRSEPVLSRLHSACFTGDLLGSLKCDCGPQLRGALQAMGDEGAGVLLYLNQEGRGIGLSNKMRAYSLQDQGFDTVDANHRLGFEDDERDFRIGAALLTRLGFSKVRLMTNNPAKVARMEDCGVTVTERVPLKVGHTHHNAHYLETKAKKSGHLL